MSPLLDKSPPPFQTTKLGKEAFLRSIEQLHASLGGVLAADLSAFLPSAAVTTTPRLAVRRQDVSHDDGLSMVWFRLDSGLECCISVSARLAKMATHKYCGGDDAVDLLLSDCPLSHVERKIVLRLARVIAARLAGLWHVGSENDGAGSAVPAPIDPARSPSMHGMFAIFPLIAGESAASLGCLDIAYRLEPLREAYCAWQALSGSTNRAEQDSRDRILNSAVGAVRVKARVVLARPHISLDRLLNLGTGELLPISIPATVPLLVSDRIVATGSLGSVGGVSALKLAPSFQQELAND